MRTPLSKSRLESYKKQHGIKTEKVERVPWPSSLRWAARLGKITSWGETEREAINGLKTDWPLPRL